MSNFDTLFLRMASPKIAGVLLMLLSISFVSMFCAWISFPGTPNREMSIQCSSNNHNTSLCALADKGLIAPGGIFLALLPQRTLNLFFMGVFVISLFLFAKRIPEYVREQLRRNASLRFYLWYVLEFSIFNPLLYAFSQGIIHPKIYESATW